MRPGEGSSDNSQNSANLQAAIEQAFREAQREPESYDKLKNVLPKIFKATHEENGDFYSKKAIINFIFAFILGGVIGSQVYIKGTKELVDEEYSHNIFLYLALLIGTPVTNAILNTHFMRWALQKLEAHTHSDFKEAGIQAEEWSKAKYALVFILALVPALPFAYLGYDSWLSDLAGSLNIPEKLIDIPMGILQELVYASMLFHASADLVDKSNNLFCKKEDTNYEEKAAAYRANWLGRVEKLESYLKSNHPPESVAKIMRLYSLIDQAKTNPEKLTACYHFLKAFSEAEELKPKAKADFGKSLTAAQILISVLTIFSSVGYINATYEGLRDGSDSTIRKAAAAIISFISVGGFFNYLMCVSNMATIKSMFEKIHAIITDSLKNSVPYAMSQTPKLSGALGAVPFTLGCCSWANSIELQKQSADKIPLMDHPIALIITGVLTIMFNNVGLPGLIESIDKLFLDINARYGDAKDININERVKALEELEAIINRLHTHLDAESFVAACAAHEGIPNIDTTNPDKEALVTALLKDNTPENQERNEKLQMQLNLFKPAEPSPKTTGNNDYQLLKDISKNPQAQCDTVDIESGGVLTFKPAGEKKTNNIAFGSNIISAKIRLYHAKKNHGINNPEGCEPLLSSPTC